GRHTLGGGGSAGRAWAARRRSRGVFRGGVRREPDRARTASGGSADRDGGAGRSFCGAAVEPVIAVGRMPEIAAQTINRRVSRIISSESDNVSYVNLWLASPSTRAGGRSVP